MMTALLAMTVVFSIALAGLAALSAGIGLAYCLLTRTRGAAPFALVVPGATAAGAGLGSWGLAFMTSIYGHAEGGQLLWSWMSGLFGGGGLGLTLGCALAMALCVVLGTGRRNRSAARKGTVLETIAAGQGSHA